MTNHPVWTVYDKLRSARLNVKYYGARLHRIERANLAIEYILLAAAPSSAVAGLWFWNTEVGKTIWQSLGVLAGATSQYIVTMNSDIFDRLPLPDEVDRKKVVLSTRLSDETEMGGLFGFRFE
jgi:hypothetical protein